MKHEAMLGATAPAVERDSHSSWLCPNTPAGMINHCRTCSQVSALGRVHITGKTPDQDSNDAVSHVFAQMNYQDNNGIVVPALKEIWHLGQRWNLFPSPEAELSQDTGALLRCAVELFWHDSINS